MAIPKTLHDIVKPATVRTKPIDVHYPKLDVLKFNMTKAKLIRIFREGYSFIDAINQEFGDAPEDVKQQWLKILKAECKQGRYQIVEDTKEC